MAAGDPGRTWRRPLTVVAAIGLTALVVACGTDDAAPTDPTPASADTVDVFTPGNIYSPTSAEIGVGGTIRWRITQSPDSRGHNVIFTGDVPGAPSDIPIVVDTTVLRTFTRAGTFPYVCTVHPGMDGDVVVR